MMSWTGAVAAKIEHGPIGCTCFQRGLQQRREIARAADLDGLNERVSNHCHTMFRSQIEFGKMPTETIANRITAAFRCPIHPAIGNLHLRVHTWQEAKPADNLQQRFSENQTQQREKNAELPTHAKAP